MLENGSSIVIVQKKYKKKELEKEYPRISYRFYLPDRVDTCKDNYHVLALMLMAILVKCAVGESSSVYLQ
eukprot:12604646-Prorocentrum_lima.AAC.1